MASAALNLVTGSWYNSLLGGSSPGKGDMLNEAYGRVGKLRQKATEAGFDYKKKNRFLKKVARQEANSLRFAQKIHAKQGIAGPKTFEDLETRRAAYLDRIENPPYTGPTRTILRSL